MSEREQELRDFAAYCRDVVADHLDEMSRAAWESRAEWADGLADDFHAAAAALEAADQTIEWLTEQNERFRAELGLPR